MPEVVWQAGQRFTHRSAQPTAIYGLLTLLLAGDGVWLHALTQVHGGLWMALGVDLLNVLGIAAIWLEHRAIGNTAMVVERDRVHLHVGWKYKVAIARSHIVRAFSPTFRDIPQLFTPASRECIDITKPAKPNVMLELSESVDVNQLGIIREKRARKIVFRVDDPAAFIAALGS